MGENMSKPAQVANKPGAHEEAKSDNPEDVHFTAGDFVKSKGAKFATEYKAIGTLGSGAFGDVKKVQHLPTGMIRAAKVLRKQALDAKEKNKLIEEVQILSTLDHPHIMRIYEMFEDEKHYYIISEFLEGGELFDRIIEQSHFSEKDAAVAIQQVLSAVAYCHKHNIVHRDLKPENLIYESKDANAHLKVIDFGTAKLFDQKTALNETFGTVSVTSYF
jgi:calcium-dependent protein kinase